LLAVLGFVAWSLLPEAVLDEFSGEMKAMT
jgi:hypothetical protein